MDTKTVKTGLPQSSPIVPHEIVIRFMFPSFPADTASQSLSIIRTGFSSISVGAISCQAFSAGSSVFFVLFPQPITIVAASKAVMIFFILWRQVTCLV